MRKRNVNKIKFIQIIEFWNSILFRMVNLFRFFQYIFSYRKINKIIKKNNILKGVHKGDRCFIVFGGMSLLDVDLSVIENEIVCVTNHFYNTTAYDIVKPNYYFACDTLFFSSGGNHVKEIVEKTKDSAKCIFSQKVIPLDIQDDHVYVTCSLHKPTKNHIHSDLTSISSNFGSVSMFAINCAIYMGFKEVYLLGYDFPAGNMPHFYKEASIEKSWRDKRLVQNDKYEVCERHWQYAQAQFENYYLAEHAIKNGVKIYNCNPASNVRSFEFKKIDEVLNEIQSV
jgi:hypothetical protein